MKDIFQWLRQIERHACDIYQKASTKFSHDDFFSSFLAKLADDEFWHYHLIDSALLKIVDVKQLPIPDIIYNDSIASLMDKPLEVLSSLLEKNLASRQDIVDCIVDAEFSEWNKIFIYSIKILKDESKEFQYAAASIQAHERRIRRFLNSLPPDIVVPKGIFELPTVWEQRVLIVEDEEPIRELVCSILSRFAGVDTATNGQDAIDKFTNHFYDLIISDIDMPIMNGLEFFENASKTDPLLSKRFIFYSADITYEKEQFFLKYGVNHINKPFDIIAFKETIRKLLADSL